MLDSECPTAKPALCCFVTQTCLAWMQNIKLLIWVLPHCRVTKCERSLHEPYAFVGSYRMGILTPLSVLLFCAYDEACVGALPPN